ncbi:molecular chaperone HtpG [Aquabacter spiritensis]|uniref:Chaperone protein HtpG n=1 Tax=Aquabacter spiritensis TaxID=933073 RepID=A0A4R3LX37_9HYPH|nr:molecular chaperone HtpG [Aquabacter spiritensis]TCT03255.1 molecular chaperone HtpG [Aquabacter spiritensis]
MTTESAAPESQAPESQAPESRSEASAPKTHAFEADVAKLLHLMVHSVYSDKDVFLRELISNAADACEKLRYEAIADPALLAVDPQPRITLTLDAAQNRLSVEDNGIGMSADELAEALGTIARSGTRAFMDRVAAASGEGAQLIGQFGVGFYSAFMVAGRVEVVSRRAGSAAAARWSSDGQGTYEIDAVDLDAAPARGTRVVLHLLPDAARYAERGVVERIVRTQSGHVPVPIVLRETPEAEPEEIADGAALWTRPKAEIDADAYTDFYHGLSGQFDTPALTLHYRAEGRQEYSVLAFVPGMKPFDLLDTGRDGRMKLYVRRVFITDDADLLPAYLRFVRGLVDSADLPLNVSREMIQESPMLGAIRKGVTGRVLGELEKLAGADAPAYEAVWENFGPVLKEGLYEDRERRESLLGLARFRTTASGGGWRGLKDYVADLKENQTAIYYALGSDLERIAASPQIEGFRARGVEVLLLPDHVDSFWVMSGLDYQGKPFKSVTQGAADLGLIPLPEGDAAAPGAAASAEVTDFIEFLKTELGASVADVRASDRLTESPVCLVAPDRGMDRQLEKILAGAGRLPQREKPVLEINPTHDLVVRLAGLGAEEAALRADAAYLLLDEARILDAEPLEDPRAFSARLARLLTRALGPGGA